MNIKSAQEKGKRFARWFVEQLSDHGIDTNARPEVGSGNGKKKGDIFSSMDFLPELKNHENPSWMPTIDQAKAQAKIGFHNPDKWLAVIRDPRFTEFQEVYAILDIQQFFILYKKAMEPKVTNPDKNVSFKLRRFLQYGKELLKELE